MPMAFQRDKLVRAVVADDVRSLQVCFQRDPRWLHTKFAHPDGWKWGKLPGWRGKKHFYRDDKRALTPRRCCEGGQWAPASMQKTSHSRAGGARRVA